MNATKALNDLLARTAQLIEERDALLAALRTLCNRLDNHGSIDVDNHCLRSEYDAARAAIAKAEGQS